MPEFMVMVVSNEADEGRLDPAETKALVEDQSAFERTLREASVYVDGERLRPSREGKRVSVRDGVVHETHGPFSDAVLGGYYVVRAENLDAAVALAAQCPLGPGASIDVRPLMKQHIKAEKSSEPGRIFAFAVLGQATTEQGWVAVMDRIDEKTREGFPTERWLGGVRLDAPGRGRRVTSTGGHRAVFDGPFLESKEVIGGLFFIRMPGLEEAARWARETEFVKLGGLEIRELWRS